MGSSHGIYNPTDHDVEWMNINVGMSKVYDAFNLGDDRVGAPKDKIPQFVTMHLDKALLKPTAMWMACRGGARWAPACSSRPGLMSIMY